MPNSPAWAGMDPRKAEAQNTAFHEFLTIKRNIVNIEFSPFSEGHFVDN